MLCTITQYQTLTADTTSATGAVENVLVEMQQRMEADLGRPGLVEYGQRTEILRLYDLPSTAGTAYPTCTPILTVNGVSPDTGLRCISDVIYGATPDEDPSTPGAWPRLTPWVVTLLYTGGYDPTQTDPQSRHFVPRCFIRDICTNTWRQLNQLTNQLAYIPGADSIRSGDQAISFKDPVPAGAPDVCWSPSTMAYARHT